MTNESEQLRLERLALCMGQTLGQLSELANNIKTVPLINDQIYASIRDILNGASLTMHEIYYKGNKP